MNGRVEKHKPFHCSCESVATCDHASYFSAADKAENTKSPGWLIRYSFELKYPQPKIESTFSLRLNVTYLEITVFTRL